MALSKGKGLLWKIPTQPLKGLGTTLLGKLSLTLNVWHVSEEGEGHVTALCSWLIHLGALI